MRDISYALFSVAAWSTNYLVGRFLVAGGVDPVAMSILRFAVATPLLFLMARFPHYRGAARRLALLGLLGVAGFNLLLYSSLAYVTAAVASLFVVLASPTTQLLEAALARRSCAPRLPGRRGGGLPHPRAVPSRPLLPRPPLGRAGHAVLGRVYRIG
jgi:drug/metabolite transporter (DMT)-like permease